MSNNDEEEIKITLVLNAEEASLVLASLQTSRSMLDQSIDMAVKDGILPVVQIAREEIVKIDRILHATQAHRHYESKSFVLNEEDAERKMKQGMDAIRMMKGKMKEEEDTPKKEEKGKDWENAGDNVVSMLDTFKKNKEDKDGD